MCQAKNVPYPHQRSDKTLTIMISETIKIAISKRSHSLPKVLDNIACETVDFREILKPPIGSCVAYSFNITIFSVSQVDTLYHIVLLTKSIFLRQLTAILIDVLHAVACSATYTSAP